MNRTEEAYAQHLEVQRRAGAIAAWWWESVKLRLADKTWYTPDFLVQLPDGALELHEVKGYLEDDAAVKLKVVAELYWLFPVYLVRRAGRDGWDVQEVGTG